MPEGRVTVKPLDPQIFAAAAELITHIKEIFPEAEVKHIGASALGLHGRGDIDLLVLGEEKDFWYHAAALEFLFGAPLIRDHASARWSFYHDGFPADLHLTHPEHLGAREELGVFEKLRRDSSLRRRYGRFLLSASGLSTREYHLKKCEWWNRALGMG